MSHHRELITRSDARSLGLKRFFTGKKCPQGHVDERLVSNGTCISCSKERLSSWFKKKAKWPDGHPRDAARNAGSVNFFTGIPCVHGHVDFRRTSDGKCRSCIKIKNKKRQRENRSYMNEKIADWRSRNKDKSRSYNAKRRSIKKQGNYTKEQVEYLLISQNHRCANPFCNKPILHKHHIDHVIPLAHGGENSDDNIQILCPKCNLSKGAKMPIKCMLDWEKNERTTT